MQAAACAVGPSAAIHQKELQPGPCSCLEWQTTADTSSSFSSSTTSCCACLEELQRCRAELAACKEALRKREEEIAIYRDALTGLSGSHADAVLQNASANRPVTTKSSGGCGSPPSLASEYKLLTDFVPFVHGQPVEASLEQVMEAADSNHIGTQVWQFGELEAGETLQQHVCRQVDSSSCPDPSIPGHLVFISQRSLEDLYLVGQHEEAVQRMTLWWRTVAALWTEWQTTLKNLMAGTYEPFLFRAVYFGKPGESATKPWNIINWPAILTDKQGRRHWGMIRQNGVASLGFQLKWSLRDLLIVKHSPITINTVAADSGALLWQNAASTAMFGCHGHLNAQISMMGWDADVSRPEAAVVVKPGGHGRDSFLQLLMGGDQEKLEALRSTVKSGKIFCARVEIVDPTLRSWMGLRPDEEAHHDVQVTQSSDPITLQQVYTVSQIDVTDEVIAQRELAEEKQRAEALLQRQYELIACLGKVTEVGQAAEKNSSAAKLIDGVRRKIAELGMEDSGGINSGVGKIETLALLGEGSYGKVYQGLWRGTVVAVKSMILPFGMSGAEKHERMAIMEAAISASLSHPNIVQTYTYSIQPVRDTNRSASGHLMSDDSARGVSTKLAQSESSPQDVAGLPGSPPLLAVSERLNSAKERGVVGNERTQRSVMYPGPRAASSQTPTEPAGDMRGFEMRLVLEFCDCGTLRDALDKGAFLIGREVNYAAVCETAADIAKGMLQLHSVNVVHSDLKARNVLLRSNASEARGVTAKIADFGLSFKMDHQETHVSSVFHGTLTHMAPEVLLHGCQSKASDIYAFGITLWELYTAGRPFQGVPQALIGHQITAENRRPEFAADAPAGYVELAQCCWHPVASKRPNFEEILGTLLALRKELGGPTTAIKVQVTQAVQVMAAPTPTPPSHRPPRKQLTQQRPPLPSSAPAAPTTPGSHSTLTSAARLLPHRLPSNALAPLQEEGHSLGRSSSDHGMLGAMVCTAAESASWDHHRLPDRDVVMSMLVVGSGKGSGGWDSSGSS